MKPSIRPPSEEASTAAGLRSKLEGCQTAVDENHDFFDVSDAFEALDTPESCTLDQQTPTEVLSENLGA